MTDKPKSTDRRTFLKKSTVAAAGASVLSSFTTPVGAFAGEDDTIKIGLVGCGGRGSGAATQALSTEGKVKLVAVADAFRDRLDGSLNNISKAFKNAPERVDVAEEKKFVGFDAYQKVIESGVDLIILATPPGFRPIHYEAAVNAGLNVFMEKPVAVDSAGVRQVLEATKIAKEKNLKVGVGLQRHHQKTYMETMKKLKDGAIGDIISMRAYWNGGGVWEPRAKREDTSSEMEYQMRNWYYYNWLCGDHITEQHIHNLDVCNWLKDAYPVKCLGMGGREVRVDPRYGEIYDHFACEYEYADGSNMFSQCRHIRGCWNSVSEHAHGSKGSCNIGAATILGEENWRYRGPKNNPYQTEHDDLFAAIRNNKAYNEAEYGAYSSLTSIMGRMATYSGKPVTWEQALNAKTSVAPETYAFDAPPPTKPDENGHYPIPTPGVTNVL